MVVSDRPMSIRLGASCGLLAVVVFSVLYLTAVSQDPGYEFLEDYLSDLGVGPGAWAFNSALVLSGALLLLFAAIGLAPLLGSSVPSRVGSGLLGLAGVLLMNVGVFTEDYGDTHFAFSVSFFLVLLAALGVMTYALYETKALGVIGTGASVSSFVFGLLLLALGMNPFTETLAVMTILVWGGLLAALMLFRAEVMRTI